MTKEECEAIIAKSEQMLIDARHRMEIAEAKQKIFDDAMTEFHAQLRLFMERNTELLLQGLS